MLKCLDLNMETIVYQNNFDTFKIIKYCISNCEKGKNEMSYKLYVSDNCATRQWDERSLANEVKAILERPLLNVFKRHIKMPGANVLEAGCGLGAFCVYFLQNGCQIVGIENQHSIVERAHYEMPGIPVEIGDVACIHYPDDSFDALISLGVIEHFEALGDIKNALKEAVRVLRPDGVAVITVPANTITRCLFSHRIRDLYFLIRSLCGRRKYFGEYRFSMPELKSFVVQAGFDIIEEGVDDFSWNDLRNMGLYVDWPFLRDRKEMWRLNAFGTFLLKTLRLVFPEKAYCAGWYVVAQKKKQVIEKQIG